MKVLIGCETSGTVRDAFLRMGHDAWFDVREILIRRKENA